MNEPNLSLPPLLEVRDLRVAFGGKEVVHGVDLAIGPGEKLALVGESGSGKTVTALSRPGWPPRKPGRRRPNCCRPPSASCWASAAATSP
jgi:ABC-type glutathione transport system ATPase component